MKLIMDLYPTLLEARALDQHDTRRIAQVIHTHTRLRRMADDIFPFIQQMILDLRQRALEPHPYAFVHFLGIYKEHRRFTEGHELWQWLVQQNETYVSQAAYGAAIELLAYGGLATPAELEDLYTDALKRFPGTFAEYHLSPDAILSDRSRPVPFTGVPTVLFQGIFTARLLAGEWKKAYLALDTILRLYPTLTPTRFFELTMHNRPVSEAYTAFMVACRAGTLMNPAQVTTLFTRLNHAMETTQSMSARVMILRAVANALYAYQEAGGSLEGLHVGILVRCFSHLLPEQMPGEDFQGEPAHLRNMIVLAAHEILANLLQAGFMARVYPFEALLSLAGNLRVPDLLAATMHDVITADIKLGPVGMRSALTSAGLTNNKEVIEQIWTGIVSNAESEGDKIAFEDWITFTKACRRSGMADYFHEQLAKLKHTTTNSIEKHLVDQMSMTDNVRDQSDFEYMSVDELTAELEGLKQQMKNIEAVLMSGAPLDLQNTPFHMHLDPTTKSLGSLEDLRAVYDEFTTDPHQPPPTSEDAPVAPTLSPTKIPFDQLRFMNWLSILEMMDQAEAWELHRQFSINQAIAIGKPYKDRPLASLLGASKHEPMASRDDLREQIRRLRNPTVVASSRYRRIEQASLIKKIPIGVMEHTNKHPLRERAQPKETKKDESTLNIRYHVTNHEAPAKEMEKRTLRLDKETYAQPVKPHTPMSWKPR
jgi:hypothetical protein